MPVETPSIFAQVIKEHLDLKERNSRLGGAMPIDHYKEDGDPFENHPLFKSEEQARIEETMDGVEPDFSDTSLEDVGVWPGEESLEEVTAETREAAVPAERGVRLLGQRRRARLRLGRLTRSRGAALSLAAITELRVRESAVSRTLRAESCCPPGRAPAARARERASLRLSPASLRLSLRPVEHICDQLQVLDELGHLLVAGFVVSLAQDGAGVDRRRHVLGEVGVDPLAALFRDAELAAQKGLRGRCAEADEHFGAYDRELRLEPGAARG